MRPHTASPDTILSALDCGADGIFAPHIKSDEGAQALVGAMTYEKGRGYADSTLASAYGGRTMKDNLTAQPAIIAKTKEAEAFEALNSLLGVAEIDACLLAERHLWSR